MTEQKKVVAISLFSGGLDSTLAAKVLLEQGITVIGVNFAGAYCPRPSSGKSNAEKAAETLGIELVTLPIDEDFVAMVKRPKHGWGKNMNPCIDCHTLMIRKAWAWGQGRGMNDEGGGMKAADGWQGTKSEGRSQKAEVRRQNGGADSDSTTKTQRHKEEVNSSSGHSGLNRHSDFELRTCPPRADFIATGEVLGQRPMSQNRGSLDKVARDSGVGDRLLRPLSAKLLDETAPEKEGLVDRSRLLNFQGRQRTPQMELAARYGITAYPAPAGGCLLTEKVYSKRLADAFDHGEDTLAMMELLRFGRHFRLPSGARLIVGRDEVENDELLRRKPADAVVIDAGDLPGPVGIVIGEGSRGQGVEGDGILAARICARFSDRRKEKSARVRVFGPEAYHKDTKTQPEGTECQESAETEARPSLCPGAPSTTLRACLVVDSGPGWLDVEVEPASEEESARFLIA